MASRFVIDNEESMEVDIQFIKNEPYASMPDIIKWMKEQCKILKGGDQELMHTLTKIFVNLKNQAK